MIYAKEIRTGEGASFNASFNASFTTTIGRQVLNVPRHFGKSGEMLFSLRSVNDLTYYRFQVIDGGKSRLYHQITIALPITAPNGEYHYELKQEGEVLADGILIVRGVPNPNPEYVKEIIFEQYE